MANHIVCEFTKTYGCKRAAIITSSVFIQPLRYFSKRMVNYIRILCLIPMKCLNQGIISSSKLKDNQMGILKHPLFSEHRSHQ